MAATPGIRRCGLGNRKTLRYPCRSTGRVIEDFQIEHSALGWRKFRQKLQPYGSIPFAIETSQGAVVEQLLEAGMIVYPLNPKSGQAYRQRKAPSGVKDDQLNAWSFADASESMVKAGGRFVQKGALIKELRLVCRDEVSLIEQRTAFVCTFPEKTDT